MSDDRVDEILIRGLDKVDRKCDDIKDDVGELTRRFETHETAFEQHLEQDKKMYEELHRMNDILQANTDSLKEHMVRTANVENTQSVQNEALIKIDGRLQVIEEKEMKKEAVKEYLASKTKKWGIRLGLVSTVLGIIYTVAKLAGWM